MVKIVTTYIYPPIPMRDFDWCAHSDDYDGGDEIGFGRTETEARLDLLEQLGVEPCPWCGEIEDCTPRCQSRTDGSYGEFMP